MEADKLILNTDIDGLDTQTYLYDIYHTMLTNRTILLSVGALKATESLKKETRRGRKNSILMKSALIVSIVTVCTLQCVHGQTVHNSRPDTTVKHFINMAKGCKVKYYSGGENGGGVIVFCAKVQFELEFMAKNDSTESYADNLIFKKVSNKGRELTTDYSVYDQFDCYALVYPQREKEPYVSYPVMISAYKRVKDDTWQHIATIRAKAWGEFSNFSDKVIHGIYDKR